MPTCLRLSTIDELSLEAAWNEYFLGAHSAC
jgi:hypothetical protein